jgi:cell division protein FtsI (penicillin-binding protein 3)
MRGRIVFLTSIVAALALAVLYRAFDLQVRQAPELKEKAEAQYLRDLSLAPKRGTIYDRAGAELAVSIDVDSVWANPRQILKDKADPAKIAAQLAPLLDLDVKQLTARLSSDHSFVWVKRRVSAAQGKAVQTSKLTGISISPEARRYYPNLGLAAHLLGYANIDGKGIDGIELMLEDKLRGSTRTSAAVRDRRGVVVYSEQLLDENAGQGNEVTLTVDKTLQHIAEHELELAVRTSEAHSGSVVVLDPASGEILAVANFPTFNPNEPQRASNAERRNRAIMDRFEPGSTLKPFTLAGAIAASAISPSQVIDCENGAMRVDGRSTIRDTHPHGNLTPAEILAFSSNIGASKIGSALGHAGLYRALTRFGFGTLTKLGLPGENSGVLRPYQQWYAMDAATIPFGQGMSTTTMQLATAMGALANHGRLMEPTLVKRIVDGHGQTVEDAVPRIRRQVVPESTARLITDMLVGVTGEGGTGTEAAIDGYLVAGKTGTAQKADPHGGYSKDRWTSSFVGYAPAQKPRLVVAVVIDEPMIVHLGGAVAAPTFRRVMEASLRHLGVPADATGTLAEQLRARRAQTPVLAAAEPPMGQPLPTLQPGEALVPNLIGRTAREAVAIALRAQFTVRLQGTGVVSAQHPVASSVAGQGALLALTLSARSRDEPPPAAAIENAAQRARAPSHPVGQALVTIATRGGDDG